MEHIMRDSAIYLTSTKRNVRSSRSVAHGTIVDRPEGITKRRATRPPTPSTPRRRSARQLALESLVSNTLTPPHESHASPEPSAKVETVEEASASQAHFRLLDLPAELRLHVYRMALYRDEPILLHLDRQPEPKETSAPPEPRAGGRVVRRTISVAPPAEDARTNTDPTPIEKARKTTASINVTLLRTCKLIHKEARQILYSENTFTLLLPSGIASLSHLHQRSRSLIKNIVITVPSHHDILDGFADLVRLGLRYCWRLKTFTVVLDGVFPDDRTTMSGATSVYATAFHILRFLPRGCEVKLKGEVSGVVKRVVEEEAKLLMELDEVSLLFPWWIRRH
jgi:epsin